MAGALLAGPHWSSLALLDIATLSLKATSLGIKQVDVVSFSHTLCDACDFIFLKQRLWITCHRSPWIPISPKASIRPGT
ncbi:hypothetical protein ARMGADRAFT_1063232 [Armillaria gallica]|uniref:Secreted protein n=1 Tax=Armillaria gallica TaxID=47427 RepID=A0A2H3DNQ1_ARMGA|nr:hypothetical protein ARMGADRAFT_1063232 [Armillaria gallica]